MPAKIVNPSSSAWRVEFRSKDGQVSVLTKWSWTKHDDVDTKHSSNVLDCTLEAVNDARLNPKDDLRPRFESINVFSTSEDGKEVSESKPLSTYSAEPALAFLWERATQSPSLATVRFLLPAADGYIVRSDFMEYSLRICPLFAAVQGFTQPAQPVSAAQLLDSEAGTADGLLKLLQSSVGAAVVADASDLGAAHTEFQSRLSWPWSIPTPIKHTRVALVGESRLEVMCKEFYAAAHACAISVIILDEPGHWAEDDNGTGAKYREHFVPFPRSAYSPEELPLRMAETIRGLPYKVDGMLALYDMLMPAVARAAEILGLPTLGSTAFRRSTDKYETRLLSPASTIMKVDSVDDLDAQLAARETPLEYPIIVKPTRSHGSKGVTRVEKEEELREALRSAFDWQKFELDRAGVTFVSSPVVLETYCDGPEVDVNLLLWNGEVLHSEVVDNCQAPGEAVTKSFGCFGSLNPSALPQDEIDMLKRDVVDIVRKLGLHSGVVHAEARVHNSSWEYTEAGTGAQPRRGPRSGQSSTFLIEINPRFAVWPETVLSGFVYGIDYFAAYLLQAIADEARFRAIAHGYKNGPTYHYSWLPVGLETEGSGVMPQSLDLESLGIAESYATHRFYWEAGALAPPKEKRRWPGAGFMVFRSAVSADDAWRAVTLARKNLRVHLAA